MRETACSRLFSRNFIGLSRKKVVPESQRRPLLCTGNALPRQLLFPSTVITVVLLLDRLEEREDRHRLQICKLQYPMDPYEYCRPCQSKNRRTYFCLFRYRPDHWM